MNHLSKLPVAFYMDKGSEQIRYLLIVIWQIPGSGLVRKCDWNTGSHVVEQSNSRGQVSLCIALNFLSDFCLVFVTAL